MIDLNVTGINKLKQAIEGTRRNLPGELRIAINATAKKVSSEVSKEIRKELALKAKDVKRHIVVKRKATKTRLSAMVQLSESRRPTLKSYGARQTWAGVSYKISKKTGRRVVKGGFMGPRPGVLAPRLRGHAFTRKGANRYPLQILRGPSPWAAFAKNRMIIPVSNVGEKELEKQITRRIRFNLLNKQGLI